jgi:hypothetical protein
LVEFFIDDNTPPVSTYPLRLKLAGVLWGLMTLLMFCCLPCQAADVHINQVVIKKPTSNSIDLSFLISPTPFFHGLIAPKLPLATFIKTYAEKSPAELQKELDSVAKKLEAGSFLTFPWGDKANVKEWKLPSGEQFQYMLKQNILILDLPANFEAHLDPIKVEAKVNSKSPIQRVQIQLEPNFYPIFVTHREDKFWLTNQIPMSVIDF